MGDFKVTYKNNREQSAVFEGSRQEVIEWLLNNSSMAWDLEVWDGKAESYADAEDFIAACLEKGEVVRDEFAVVFKNDPERSRPAVFQGDRKEVIEWLNERAIDNGTLQVYDKDQRKYFDTLIWLQMHGALQPAHPASTEGMSTDTKMQYEALHDPFVQARNEMIRQWIKRAIRLSGETDRDPQFLVNQTAHEIIRLFY